MKALYRFFFGAMLVLAPFWPTGSTIVMALLFVLMFFIGTEKHTSPIIPRWIWFFVAYFALYALGMLWTDNTGEGWRSLQVKLPFLILPWVVWGAIRVGFTRNDFRVFLWMGVGIAFLLMNNMAIRNLGEDGSVLRNFTGSNFSQSYLHRAYFMNYIAAGVFMTVFSKIKGSKSKWMNGILVVLSLLVFSLLLGRMNIVAMVLVTPFVWYFSKKKNIMRWVMPITLLALVASALIFNFPPTRFSASNISTHEISQISTDTVPENASRVYIWKEALSIYADNPVLGVGTGDIHDALNRAFESDGHEPGREQHFNVHNEYIQILTVLGPIGLAALLFILMAPIRSGWKNRDGLLLVSVIYFALTLLTEVYFDRFHGIFIYVAVISFLWGTTTNKA